MFFFKANAQLSEDFHHENRPSKTLDVENNGMETRTTSRGPELGSTDGGRSKKKQTKEARPDFQASAMNISSHRAICISSLCVKARLGKSADHQSPVPPPPFPSPPLAAPPKRNDSLVSARNFLKRVGQWKVAPQKERRSRWRGCCCFFFHSIYLHLNDTVQDRRWSVECRR